MTRSRLARRPAERNPKKRFVLFCEGLKTEPAYLKALQNLFRGTLLEIIPGAGVPLTLANKACAKAREIGVTHRRNTKIDLYQQRDEVWIICDRDTHPNFDQAMDLCRRAGIGIARSNPCFELWLILHQTDYDKPDESAAVQDFLRTLCPEYDPTSGKAPDCANLLQRISNAELRAEKQLAARSSEGSSFGRPSTTVHKLVCRIREAQLEWSSGNHSY